MVEFTKTDSISKAIQNKVNLLTERRWKYKPSPIYSFTNSALAANAYQLFDFANVTQVYSTFAPFTNLQIINNSGQTIYAFFGDQYVNYDIIPAGQIKNYDSGALGGGISQLRIQNAGSSSVSASTINISVYKSGVTQDDLAALEYDDLQTVKGTAKPINLFGGFNIEHG